MKKVRQSKTDINLNVLFLIGTLKDAG